MRAAMKPPTLTIPVAVPIRCEGLNVRAKSKPIMEPGPPMASTTTKRTRSQSGARSGRRSTAAHAMAVAVVIKRTIADLRMGCLETNRPSPGPATMAVATKSAIRADTVPASSPWAESRNGYPQVIAKRLPLNCTVKWLHRPSLVPGCFQALDRETPVARSPWAEALAGWPGGASRNRQRTRTTANTDIAASVRNAGVHPAECSNNANGTTLNSWPSWPHMPVNWVTRGTLAGANHRGTRRITEMNVMASPAPTRTRPRTPPGMLSAKASWSCPAAMRTAPPATMTRDPNRSTSTPTGICSPA
ncbi:hypothetical protein PJL18_02652 [Paenarthrobacter nicotinovorans]|nr:hypothetical protein [Paenarthrobacter nicotinovorans]